MKWNITCKILNLLTYGHLIYDKGSKNIQWSKDSLFNKVCRENWTAMCTMRSEHFLVLHNSPPKNRFKDLYVRPEIIKLLEENIDVTLFAKSHTNIF